MYLLLDGRYIKNKKGVKKMIISFLLWVIGYKLVKDIDTKDFLTFIFFIFGFFELFSYIFLIERLIK